MSNPETIRCYNNAGQAVEIARDAILLRPGVYGIAFTDDRGQVLLTRDRRSTVWELPGGGLGSGETARAAMIREFKEEVGLDIRLGPALYFADSFYHYDSDGHDEGWHSIKLFYLVHTQGILDARYAEQRAPGEATYGAAWVPVDELESVDMLADHYDAVQHALHWLEATEGPAATDDSDDDDE